MKLFSTKLVTNKNATWLVDNEVDKAIMKLPGYRDVDKTAFGSPAVALDMEPEFLSFLDDETDSYDVPGVHYTVHDLPDYELIEKRQVKKIEPKNGAHPSGLDPSDYTKEKGWTGDDGMARRIVYFMLTNDNPCKEHFSNYNRFHDLFTKPQETNIIYIANSTQKWEYKKDTRDEFDDQRIILRFKEDGRTPYLDFYQTSTCDPGVRYTKRRMNPKGAAQVLYGQQIGWVMGYHNYKSNHPALINSSAGRPIAVARDANADFERANDVVDIGYHFVNQHHGWNTALNYIGSTSAGCLVGSSSSLHLKFIGKLRKDPRYLENKKMCWTTTIIPMEFLAAGKVLDYKDWT